MLSPVHIHLLLNHIPVIGVFIGLFVLLYGTVKKSEDIKRASLLLFLLFALISIPVYLTGEPAEEVVEDLPGVSHDFIEEHEESALFSFISILALGLLSLIGLVVRNQKIYSVCLILALIAGGLVSWTANLGGQIRHSEIRSGAEVPAESHED